MIKLLIPKEHITYARMIEGRKFKEGFWYFPESSLQKLRDYGLIPNETKVEEKQYTQYDLSDHLREYQKKLVNTALNYGSYALFSDTGTGKTVMGLELATHYKKTLIVCPLSVIETAWIDDCRKFYPNKKIVSIWDKSKPKRLELLRTKSDIYVTNFEGLKVLYNELIIANFDCIIVDESSKMKNLKSLVSQQLLKLKEHIDHRYILSGCPTPNHNSEIFPQMKFINEDVFGNNYHGFLARYFSQDMTNPHRWFQTQNNKDNYFNRLSEQSQFLKKEECVDLPDKIFQLRKFNLEKEQERIYNNILDNIKDNVNTWSKFEFTAKLMKLREVISGFIIDKNGCTTDFKTGKDKELEQCLNEIGDKQVIVWCQFTHEIDRLSKKFNGVGLTSKTKDRDDIIRNFKENKIKILFVHPKLLGMGLTFVNCSYNIYYSLSYSYEEFKQSQDRIHRIGQENKCTYVILQADNTIDDKIYKCLQNKKNAVDELYIELGIRK